MRAPVPNGTVSLVAVLPMPVRKDGVSRHSAPVGDAAYAAIPNMVPVYEAQRSHRQASQSSGVLQMQKNPWRSVEPPGFLPRRARWARLLLWAARHTLPSGQFIYQVTSTTVQTCYRGAILEQQTGVFTQK